MTRASRFSGGLPERLLFADRLKVISRDLTDHITADEGLHPKVIEATKRTGWFSFTDTPLLLDTPVLGAEEVIVDTFSYADGFEENPSGLAFYLDLYLHKQGKPFIPETDLLIAEALGFDASNGYVVHANPDMPPMAVSLDFTDHVNNLDLFGLRSLVAVATEYGEEAVHKLTDEECASLTTALGKFITAEQLDIEDMELMHGVPS